ncbi:GNAT family N-acetyltransferase [Methylomonas koyamae]|uniref:GNAT family N-acetyltransferase n=1 Tax=Methylomonas koyamae TaxID=702114 RepID=UPI00112C09CA|nr:GNAT family N-acetyltransferase [Methylomonas koyamae]TPQ29479.1 GNAT family N-acetyltransferase [Methylomonas koyamae]
MQIVTASEADIPAMCRLLAQLFEQEAEFVADETAQRRGLSQIIAEPALGRILVARRDGEILGMVNLLFSVSTALGSPVAWLEDMVVDRNQRGGAIGSALLQHAVGFAKQQGCRRITLLTDADNSAGQRFYRRHGFELSPMRPMRLLLP